MKKDILIKTAIASAVIAATTATTVADTKLYGRFRAGVVCTDDPIAGGGDECALENRSSRFGIKVDQAINDGLTAFGKYEFGVNLDEGTIGAGGNNATNRLAYVGLKGGMGEVSIGTRWSPMYNYVTSPVDPQQLLGGTWQGTGYASSFRRADTINYKNKFGAVGMHLQVQMDESAGNNDIDEVQIGAGGKLGPVNLGLAYQDTADVGSVVGVHGATKFGALGLGLSYYNTSTDTGVAAIQGKGEGDYLLGLISYGIGGGRTINVTLGQDMPDAAGAPEPFVAAAEYEHKLSKNFRWFAAIQNTDRDIVGVSDELKYGAGMRLEF